MVLARWQSTIVDDEGNVQDAASVEVRSESSGALVPLYSDRGGATPIGNPFSSDGDGFAAFHVVGGAYRITATKGAFSRIWRYVGIGTSSELDATDVVALIQNVDAGYALRFEAETSAPPTSGSIRFNNASLASATEAYVSVTNFAGSDITDRLLELFSAVRGVKDGIILSDVSANEQASFTITSATDNTTYITLGLSGHQGETSFTDDSVVNLQRERAGNDGTSAGILFAFDSSTAMADPGAGEFRLNHATPSSVTAIAVDDTSAASGNPDVSAAVLAWDDSTNTIRGTLIIEKLGSPQVFAIYNITGATTDNSGWSQLAVTHVASAGTLANGEGCVLKFSRAGDKGTDGQMTGPGNGFSVADQIAIFSDTTGATVEGAVDGDSPPNPIKSTDLVYGPQLATMGMIIGTGLATITTGIKGDLRVPFACTITGWTLLADQSGSIVVDIWKDTYANFPPVIGDVITASAKPTITTATKNQSSSLTGWTTALAEGDILRFNVNSVTTHTRVTIALHVTKTQGHL